MRVRFRKAMEFAVENSLLMVLGTVIALIWANTDSAGYEAAVHPLHFVVNDIGMVFFFGLAMKEIIEATAAGGPLDSFRRASVPVIAAVGGMAGPAAVYVALVSAAGAPELLRGWAIPCATDIAFSYLIARFVFGSAHPAVPFLLLLAIADDAFGLVILAVFYPSSEVRLVWCAVLLLGITLSALLATMTGLHLPAGLLRRDLVVVGLTAAIGFTVALFFATAAFPPGMTLAEAKLGALFSLSAAVLAPAAAWAMRVGRFAVAVAVPVHGHARGDSL